MAVHHIQAARISFYVSYQSDAYAGGYIGIGTGTTPVARTDYKLQTQVGSWTADDTPTISGDSIIVAAGITLTSGATVSEAGLALEGVENGGSYSYNFMFLIFHDTFTGFAVSADQTVQVQYTLNLPSGTNNNFIGYLARLARKRGSLQQLPYFIHFGNMDKRSLALRYLIRVPCFGVTFTAPVDSSCVQTSLHT